MDITQKVIDRIVSQCKEKGFVIDPHLALFMAKSVIMNDSLGFNVNTDLSIPQLDKLIKVIQEIDPTNWFIPTLVNSR